MTTLTRRTFLRVASLGAAAAASPLATPAAHAAWTQQTAWADIVAAARAEGTLSLLTWGETWGGVGFPEVIARFEEVFSRVTVTLLGENSADVWLARVREERQSGELSFDLAIVQPDAALQEGAPEGMWAPIEPLLIRPDVRADGAWRDGFAARFLDTGGNLGFSWEYHVINAYAINTDLVQVGEIKTVEDLAGPRWTGKVISSDPRLGLGLASAAAVARNWDTDMVRRLLVEQRPTIVQDGHALVESLVLGKYPVALGVRPKALQEFLDQGLGQHVAFLNLPDADFAVTTPLLLFDRAPLPAAAKLFANWILTQEGQTILTSSLPTNSARTDVEPFVREAIGIAGATYYEPDREANFSHTARTRAFIADLLGP